MITMKTKKITFMALAFFACSATFAQSDLINALSGEWQFVASPFEGGEERISFTATPSTDGSRLQCHAENFFAHASKPYPADWCIAVEQEDDKVRLGWILDSSTPCSTEEYQEPATSYALFGTDADGTHRYIYLLSENIETHSLEGMTLWSDWQTSVDAAFSLPKTYQIYAVVSENQPYNGAVGYIDIWASGKIMRSSGATILNVTRSSNAMTSQPIFNLTGQRISNPTKGIYIINCKKYQKH